MTINTTIVINHNVTKELDNIVSKFSSRNLNTAARILSVAMVDMFGGVIEDTPVGDFDPSHEGMTKANWQLTSGSPATGVLNKREPRRKKSSLKIPSKPKALFNIRWWFANNMPGVVKLEFGGYPENVKFGSYNRRTRSFEIRTTGGFSKQAPAGMFRKNLAQWPKFLKNAQRKIGRRKVI